MFFTCGNLVDSLSSVQRWLVWFAGMASVWTLYPGGDKCKLVGSSRHRWVCWWVVLNWWNWGWECAHCVKTTIAHCLNLMSLYPFGNSRGAMRLVSNNRINCVPKFLLCKLCFDPVGVITSAVVGCGVVDVVVGQNRHLVHSWNHESRCLFIKKVWLFAYVI